ncbi:flocculation protein FLO11 [Acyrthosiphon pisum]|uniref:Uncharacterized protein n=1 Tax=Acyrthosiphon pisum TaxID=7029 RepID=A0A8R2NS47_ACYPI|nr:flocculation protein FLO11 [Acyrthosiphon pisum]
MCTKYIVLQYCEIVMYFRMILFSYICIVSILEFVVTVQADTRPILNNNELSLSLSNEQVTEYNYERTIQSAATKNNQDHSITTNINTEFVQNIHSSNELDLNVADSSDLNSALNMDRVSEMNMLNNNEASINNDYRAQMSTLEISNTEVKTEGDTGFMSPNGVKDSPNYNNPNGDLTYKQDRHIYDSNGNKISDTSIMNNYQSPSGYYGYSSQNIADVKGGTPTTATSSPGSNGSPSSATPTSPSGNLNTAPDSKQKPAAPSTTTPTSNSNGSPSSSSPKSPTGDSTGKPNGQDYDYNGNKISDTSIMNNYQSSSGYYGYISQNRADVNGGTPTTATSSPGSNGSPSNATPTSPSGNLNSAPDSKQKPAAPSTTTPTSNSNGSPSSSSPKSPTGDSTGKPNGQDYDYNGNKISDTSIMNNYQSSSGYYGYISQNRADVNGGTPTTATSSPGSNGSPSSATPTSPSGNLNSAPDSKQKPAAPSTTTPTSNSNGFPSSSSPKSPTGDSTGKPNGQDYDYNGNKISDTSIMNNYQSSSGYYGYISQNRADVNGGTPTTATSSPGSNGSPSSATPTSPSGNLNSAPDSKQKPAAPSTTTPTSNSNGSPSSSSPKSPTGDSTGKPNGQDYDYNGNKISDTSIMNNYQSSSGNYGYISQNRADVNGGTPTTATSSPGSNGSPSSATPTSPSGNLNTAPDSKQKPAAPSTTTPTSNSNGSPSSSSPKSPTGDSTSKPNGQDYDSNGNKISDTSIMNNYQSSSGYYGYSSQNRADVNGGTPTTATSSPGSNGSPSSATPTSPSGNLNTAPDSKQKPAAPSTTTPTSNSNGSPSSSSPKSPTGDSTGKPNGQDYDYNGNKISDTSIMNNYQSSSGYYGYISQNRADVNGGTPTTATSSPGSNGSPSSATPTSPSGNLNSAPDSKQKPAAPSTTTPTSNSNGSPSSSSPKSPTGDSTSKPNGQDYDSNGNKISDTSIMNNYQSSSGYYGYSSQNRADVNGGTPTTATSSPGSNGSPSSATPTSPSGNLNTAPDSKQKPAAPSTTTPTSNSNGSPSSSSPKSPTGDSTSKPNGQDYDSNGNKLSDNSFMNSYQTSNYYGSIQNTADQDTSYNYPPEMSEYLNNLLLQNSVSSFNLQNTATPDQFGIIPSSSLIMPNGNSKGSLNSGGTGLNTPTDMNGSPNTVDQTLTATEYSSLGSETYGSSNFDIDYDLRNMDAVEVSNDGQLNMDVRYISDNYDDVNNGGYNMPLLNENGDIYNNYLYADNSVKTVRSLNSNFDTQNDNNYVDGYIGNVPFDDGNMQEPSYEPYASNLNARYESSQLKYGLNQNPPPFRGYPYMGNDIAPFDTNIYPDTSPQMSVMNSDLYNYNNIDGIEYDQTKIGIDESSPENIQLSMSDLNTFSSTQMSQATDSFIDTDLPSDRLIYDFVDADNRDLVTIDSNYIGQVNENNMYNGQGLNGYNNMQSINVPEYNQFNGDYTSTYLSNLGTFETSSSNTGTDAAVDGPEGPYLTPQLLNSKYDLPHSSDLNKLSSDSNSLIIDNVQFNGYLYGKTDTENVNTQVEGSAAINSIGSPMKAVDNRFKSIQTTVLSKNNELDAVQNVYGANGQVIGRIYKPSGIVKTKNRNKYSGSSSYSSPNDSEFSDDMHAIGHDIKRAARDAIGNVHDNIKDAYDTTKAVGKAVGNIAGNAASKVADGVSEAADDVEETAKTAYQGTKDAAKSVGNAVGEAANDVGETAKTAYQDSKDVVNAIENAVSDASDDVEETT